MARCSMLHANKTVNYASSHEMTRGDEDNLGNKPYLNHNQHEDDDSMFAKMNLDEFLVILQDEYTKLVL
jgi:hypothetical protein